MKCLIVNGDDFGASIGISRGIIQAHARGILTSTSLMVDGPAAHDAVALAREHPGLSVGLHLKLDATDPDAAPGQCDRQLERFRELTGESPTHVDSHHDVHRDPRVHLHVIAFGLRVRAPVRGYSTVRHVGKFYGRWGGATHPEQIGVEGFVRLLDAEVRAGVTELSCHPGFVDAGFHSSYHAEREVELRTLCNARVRDALDARKIRLIGFRDLPASAPAVATATP